MNGTMSCLLEDVLPWCGQIMQGGSMSIHGVSSTELIFSLEDEAGCSKVPRGQGTHFIAPWWVFSSLYGSMKTVELDLLMV